MNPIVFVVLAAVLIGGAFYLVALPILQHARRVSTPPALTLEQERLDDLLANRDAAFQALRELNFDHRVGKITDEDFVEFEAHMKRNAAETLRALDAWEETDGDWNHIIEQAVLERSRAIERDHSADGSGDDGRICSSCGKPASAADRFCGGCGAPLPVPPEFSAPSVTEPACPNCGHAYEQADKFCARCGLDLGAKKALRSQR